MSNPIKVEKGVILTPTETPQIRKVIDFASGRAKAITLPKEFLDRVGQEFEEVETKIMRMNGKYVLLVIPHLEKIEEKEE